MQQSDVPDGLSAEQRALLLLRRMKAQLDAVQAARREPVAIIGMGCRFPGDAVGNDAFWRVLEGGVDAVTEVPPDRWDAEAYYDPDPARRGRIPSRWGAFVNELDAFDPMFFGLSPREAALMDPQHRLLLEVSHEALEDACIDTDSLAGSNTGVFLGLQTHDYYELLCRETEPEMQTAAGIDGGFAAGRLAFLFDLKGPCLTVNTQCSSSLVAVHLAVQSLRSGECDLAIVGGASAILDPVIQKIHARLGTLSPTGRCRAFDAAADGIVRGEGCGVVVLKRLSDARAGGDRIHALVRGTACGQDGRGTRLTAPNSAAHVQVMQAALMQADVSPERVTYIQAHGTGTALGDPVEFEALRQVYGVARPTGETCAVGSVKTNIGHLEAAAGVASLITAVLALRHERIPPNLHFRQLNPYISLVGTPLVIPVQPLAWRRGAEPRCAAVSSFGMSGTNAHAVLEEAPPASTAEPTGPPRPWHLLTVSAQTPAALSSLVARWVDRAEARDDAELSDLAWSANTGRSAHSHRLAVVVRTRAELAGALREASAELVGSTRRGRAREPRPKVAFLFTGQGAQYPGMTRQLFETSATFRAALEHSAAILRPHLDRPLLDVLFGGHDDGLIDDTAYAQPALVAVELALAGLWRSWGVEPDMVLGHSIGEYAAAHVAGVFSLEDVLRLVAERGRLMSTLPRTGAMWALGASEAELTAALEEYHGTVSIAAVNGPQDCVISGDADAVGRLARAFEERGRLARRLTVSHAFHSHLMEPILGALEGACAGVGTQAPRLPLIANLTGREHGFSAPPAPSYWARHAREPVRFLDGVRRLAELEACALVEIGPRPILLGMAARCLPAGERRFLPSLRPGQDDWRILLESAATLWIDGARLDRRGIDRDHARRVVDVPTYPFQRQRYWYRPNRMEPPHAASQPRYEAPTSPRAERGEPSPAGGREPLNGASGATAGASEVAVGASEPARAVAAVSDTTPALEVPELDTAQLRAIEPTMRARLVHDWLTAAVAAGLRCRPDDLDPDRSLGRIGVDSLIAIELRTAIETRLGVSLPVARILGGPSISELTAQLLAELGAAGLAVED